MSDSVSNRTGSPLGRGNANGRGNALDPSKPDTHRRESTRPDAKRTS